MADNNNWLKNKLEENRAMKESIAQGTRPLQYLKHRQTKKKEKEKSKKK